MACGLYSIIAARGLEGEAGGKVRKERLGSQHGCCHVSLPAPDASDATALRASPASVALTARWLPAAGRLGHGPAAGLLKHIAESRRQRKGGHLSARF